MSLSRHALLALLIAAGATVASLAVWANGRVDLGFQLAEIEGEVRVIDVTPHGIAAQEYWQPDMTVLELGAVDGRDIPTGVPVSAECCGFFAPPTVAIEEPAVEHIVVGYHDPEGPMYDAGGIDRGQWLSRLDQGILAVALGVALGIAVWRLLAHGLAGDTGRQGAALFGAVVAAPLLIVPTVYAGTATGIAAGFLVPIAVAAVAGSWLARRHSDPAWRRTGEVAAVVIAGLAAVLVGRFMGSQWLPRGDEAQIYTLTGAIALVPAGMSALGASVTSRERLTLLSFGLLPVVIVVSVLEPTYLPYPVPVMWVGAALGWQLLPLEHIGRLIGRAYRRPAPQPVAASVGPPATGLIHTRRDVVALAIAGVVASIGVVSGQDTWPLIVGIALGGLVGLAVRRGLLGVHWGDAAVPLGVSVAIPILCGAFWSYGSFEVPAFLGAVGGLPVAHLLAGRNADPAWRRWLLIIAVAFVVLVVLLTFFVHEMSLAMLLAVGVTLLPAGVNGITQPAETDAGRSTSRLETLVVGLTPAIGLVLVFAWGAAAIATVAWLVVLFAWRRFSLAPLLGFVQRTQQQLDLAVAAAEQERARLAADLHDDALQELTSLVRRLDEAGDAEGAEMARGIAERLRGITSDLRLPLLDDLGAGPALEWLVGRVRPLAGGEVRLERSDPSRPPSAVELAVFRVAQEALANAINHGKAPITVRYHVDEAGHVSLTVDDAGPGIDLEAAEGALANGHLGVANMRQRAEQIGGLLNIRAWPTGGTHVGLEWRPQ